MTGFKLVAQAQPRQHPISIQPARSTGVVRSADRMLSTLLDHTPMIVNRRLEVPHPWRVGEQLDLQVAERIGTDGIHRTVRWEGVIVWRGRSGRGRSWQTPAREAAWRCYGTLFGLVQNHDRDL